MYHELTIHIPQSEKHWSKTTSQKDHLEVKLHFFGQMPCFSFP